MLLKSPETNKHRPPKGFKAVKGLSVVRTIDEPQFAKTTKKQQGSKRRGLIFEQRVVDYLDNLSEDIVGFPGMWFEFVDFHGHRYAQSDWVGLNVKTGVVYIVEVKLSRVPKAWWQLNKLYKPLVERVLGEGKIALVEVATDVKNVAVPEDVELVWDLTAAEPDRTSFMRLDYDC